MKVYASHWSARFKNTWNSFSREEAAMATQAVLILKVCKRRRWLINEINGRPWWEHETDITFFAVIKRKGFLRTEARKSVQLLCGKYLTYASKDRFSFSFETNEVLPWGLPLFVSDPLEKRYLPAKFRIFHGRGLNRIIFLCAQIAQLGQLKERWKVNFWRHNDPLWRSLRALIHEHHVQIRKLNTYLLLNAWKKNFAAFVLNVF